MDPRLTFYLLVPVLISALIAFVPPLQTPWRSAVLCFAGSLMVFGSMMIFALTIHRPGWLSFDDITMAFVPFMTLFLSFLVVRQFSRPLLMLLVGPLAFLLGIGLLFVAAVLMGAPMG
jgi:hypothetical protein